MSIPHFFQITESETISDFEQEILELNDWIRKNREHVVEKLDGVSFRTKIIDDEFVYVDKSGRHFALYDIVQSNFPQNFRNKLVQCLKKFNWLLRNGLKGYFLRLGLDNPNTFLSFEYVNGRQNAIHYTCDGLFFNSFVRDGVEVPHFDLTPQTVPSISEVFSRSPSPSYHPSRHPLEWETVSEYEEVFDLPEGLRGLPTALIIPQMSRKSFAEFRNGVVTDENRVAMTVLDGYLRFWQTQITAATWSDRISDQSEGLIITGFRNYPKFKLIGDFFLDNLTTENRFNSYFVAMAGMKPPHKGHMRLIRETLVRCRKYNAKFRLFLSEARRGEITLDAAKEVLGIYLENEDFDPGLLEIIAIDGNQTFAAAEEFVKTLDAGATVYFVCGSGDAEKTKEFLEYFEKTYPAIFFEVSAVLEERQTDGPRKLSATDMRTAVKNNNFSVFRSYLPEKSIKDADRIWEILRNCYVDPIADTTSYSNYEYSKMPRIRIG